MITYQPTGKLRRQPAPQQTLEGLGLPTRRAEGIQQLQRPMVGVQIGVETSQRTGTGQQRWHGVVHAGTRLEYGVTEVTHRRHSKPMLLESRQVLNPMAGVELANAAAWPWQPSVLCWKASGQESGSGIDVLPTVRRAEAAAELNVQA